MTVTAFASTAVLAALLVAPVAHASGALEVELGLSSSRHVAGEPIVLGVALRNVGPRDLLIPAAPDGEPPVTLELRRGGERVHHWSDCLVPYLALPTARPARVLRSGDAVFGFVLLGRQWVVHEPGDYEVRGLAGGVDIPYEPASLVEGAEPWHGETSSPTLRVTVASGTRAEQALLDSMLEPRIPGLRSSRCHLPHHASLDSAARDGTLAETAFAELPELLEAAVTWPDDDATWARATLDALLERVERPDVVAVAAVHAARAHLAAGDCEAAADAIERATPGRFGPLDPVAEMRELVSRCSEDAASPNALDAARPEAQAATMGSTSP